MHQNTNIKPLDEISKPNCCFRSRELKFSVIEHELDVYDARSQVFSSGAISGFDRVRIHSLMTVITELANNIVFHSQGGSIRISLIEYRLSSDLFSEYQPAGVCVFATDKGPGIKDITMACTEGYSTKQSLGCGLSGVVRLADRFQLSSSKFGTSAEAFLWCTENLPIQPQLYLDQFARLTPDLASIIAFNGGRAC
jgi:serine/threonine-protein kinase RsbT